MKWFASHSNAIKQHMSCCSWEVSFVISSFLKLKKECCVVASQHFFAFKDCRDQLFNFTSALLFLLDGGFQLPRIAWCQLTAVDSSRASLAPGLSLRWRAVGICAKSIKASLTVVHGIGTVFIFMYLSTTFPDSACISIDLCSCVWTEVVFFVSGFCFSILSLCCKKPIRYCCHPAARADSIDTQVCELRN